MTLVVTNDPDAVRGAHADALARFPGPPVPAFEATFAYLWTVCRAAVYVCVRDWRIRVFLPFCNHPGFRNPWGQQLTGHVATAVGEAHGSLPPDRWWCNADLLCTKPASPEGWSVGPLPVYRDFLEQVLRQHPVRHAAFFLNRRDHPLVRRDGHHPYGHVWQGGRGPHLGTTDGFLPVLSPYGSPAFRDHLVPTDVCWTVLRQGAPVAATPWAARQPRAFFRGTATNPLRTTLVRVLGHRPDFDVALTHSGGGRLVARRGHVVRTSPSGHRDRWVPPRDWARYKVVLAVDGHCGLNRWAHLVRSGAWIVRVSGSVAPDTLLASLVPHEHVDGTAPDWCEQLVQVVARLLGRPRGPPPVRDLRRRVLDAVAGSGGFQGAAHAGDP